MASSAFTIELRDDLAEMVRAKVAAGEYDSEREVIEHGLDALREEEAASFAGPQFDRWVRDELRPAVEAYRANPSLGVPLEVVRAELAERHARRLRQG